MTTELSPQQNPHGDGRYIPALDGWRAIAIGMVLLFHGLFNSDTDGHLMLGSISKLAARCGALGVLVFFCISGYLITSRLHADSVLNNDGRVAMRAFYTKRVFRILPPMLLNLAVIGLLGVLGVIHLVKGDWAATFFLSNYFEKSWHTDHYWSLAIEEQFYLVWPLCILLAGWRRAIWLGVGIIAAVGVWRPWQLAHIPVGKSDPSFHMYYGTILAHTGSRIDYIMAGCVVALVAIYHPGARGFLRWCGTGLGMIVLFALLAVSTLVTSHDLRTIQAVVLALMICGSSQVDTWFSRTVLRDPLLMWVGKISYSLYLWQQLVLSWSRYAWMRFPWLLPVKWAVALGVAYVSYRWVERPMIRMGRRVLEGSRAEFVGME